MLDRIIKLSVDFRVAVLISTLALAAVGLWSFQHLSIDAVPDITNLQVQVNSEAQGFTPLEAEQRITLPLENAMAGLAGLDHTRSLSRYGLSQVTIVFSEGTDLYFARQQVAERLQAARGRLPQGIEPQMGPATTGLGEIFMYTVDAAPLPGGGTADVDVQDLRQAQEWIVRPQLLRVPGVADVNTIGGFQKQYLVQPDADRLLAYGLTLADLVDSLERNNANRGASYIERNGQQVLLRIPGQLDGGEAALEELRGLVVRSLGGTTIRVDDVAVVSTGSELRIGGATQNGREVVLGTVMMRVGENSREVASAVAARLPEINATLPPGMLLSTTYDRTTLVDKTLGTVQKNLVEGALLVIVVLFVLLGNLRAALLTAMVIPVVMLMTITGMVKAGVWERSTSA
jgi:cobalt-zinc-cadmium resistance protein CzcA